MNAVIVVLDFLEVFSATQIGIFRRAHSVSSVRVVIMYLLLEI